MSDRSSYTQHRKMAISKRSTITNESENKAFWKGVLFHHKFNYLAAETNTEHPEMAGETMFQ